jgi:hypothetical protein
MVRLPRNTMPDSNAIVPAATAATTSQLCRRAACKFAMISLAFS